MKLEKCEYCDGAIEQAVRRVPFRYKKETIYVDSVPVRVCRRCGETYYEAEVYKKLEKDRCEPQSDQVQGHVPVSGLSNGRLRSEIWLWDSVGIRRAPME